MKIAPATVIIIALFISCTKENTGEKVKATDLSNAAAAISVPLNDLGMGTYMGYTGGLYPGGVNAPSGQYAADLLQTCKSIVPIDKLGNPATNGKIVFISLGASIGGNNMQALKAKTVNNPATNPKLLLLNCCDGYGLASINSLMNPNDSIWDHVTQILTSAAGSSYAQVQIVYMETEDSSRNTTFPARPNLVKSHVEACMRVFKQKFPNIKVLYVLGRTRTFGSQRPWNKEPSPYYLGWAFKWAIEDQINGVAGTAYNGSNAVATMTTWGWYEWAGTSPRTTDGFAWLANETSDGIHANDRGQDTLSTRFQNFLLTDQYARIWYAAH